MVKNYFDKNGKLLKIGQLVLTRTGRCGIIIAQEPSQYNIDNEYEDDQFFIVKYFSARIIGECQGGFFPKSLTIVTEAEAMIWILEQQ